MKLKKNKLSKIIKETLGETLWQTLWRIIKRKKNFAKPRKKKIFCQIKEKKKIFHQIKKKIKTPKISPVMKEITSPMINNKKFHIIILPLL